MCLVVSFIYHGNTGCQEFMGGVENEMFLEVLTIRKKETNHSYFFLQIQAARASEARNFKCL
jgi:hypothetical protein